MGRRKDRAAWHAQRQLVMARAGRMCERCRMRRGHHVHHLRYAAVIGHEPIDWLQLLCLECHGDMHPRHTFHPVAVQRDIARAREKRRKAQGLGHRGCRHCGGMYSKAKHRATCVRFGLHTGGGP